MKCWKAAAAVAAIMTGAGAGAAELEYGFEVGVGTTDNIQRVPVAEQSETILTTGLDFTLLREEGRLHADVDLDLSYFEYQDDTYGGEVVGMAQADLRYLFVPGRFEWVLLDSFGQSVIDPFSPVTPDNRENFNYVTTGPDFTMRLGSAGSLTLFGRYSATQFEDSNLDDERLLAGVSFGRELSARSSLSLNVTSETIEFDDPLAGTDFDRRSAFLRYETEGARTRIAAEAGYTELEFDGPVGTSSSPLFELEISRDVSARSSLTLRGAIESSDASTALRGGEIGGGFPGQVSTGDPFETRHLSLGWNFAAQRTDLFVSVGYEEEGYETTTLLDRERQLYQALVSRRITPRFSIRAQALHYRTDFSFASQEDDETQLGLAFDWNLAGRLYLLLDLEQFERNSTNPLSEFDEQRAFLRLAWRSSGAPGG